MLQQHLTTAGPIIYPLLLCSLIAGMLVLERLWVVCRYRWRLSAEQLQAFERGNPEEGNQRHGALAGLSALHQHRHFSKPLRDELLNDWLGGEKRLLQARSRWLMLIGGVAPLLGLLGTVLGIITMFQEVAHQAGPVTPALLAGGMWEAMATTAMGLIIAVPAIVMGQGVSIWSEQRLEQVAAQLNGCSLWIEKQRESSINQTTASALAAA